MEIKTNDTYFELFKEHGLGIARLISWSKSTYRKMNPENIVVFNANIFTEEDGKVWFGDLDITLDGETLKELSKNMSKKLYVLNEYHGRWGDEEFVDLEKSYFIIDEETVTKNF